jgi:hypothetical protein
VQGERALLEVHVPQGSSRGLVAEAHRACRSGQPLRDAKNAVLARPANEAAPKGVATPADATSRMMQFVADYLQETGPFSPAAHGRNYADNVDYYKQRRSRQEILTDKVRYATRWPSRSYVLVSGSLAVAPATQSPGQFDVTFEYTFHVANAKESKEGRGVTRLIVEMAGADIRILSEDGDVIQRR